MGLASQQDVAVRLERGRDEGRVLRGHPFGGPALPVGSGEDIDTRHASRDAASIFGKDFDLTHLVCVCVALYVLVGTSLFLFVSVCMCLCF